MLYLIRHGQTDWNAEGRLQGRQDIALNSQGRSEAAHNGQNLARLITNHHDFDFVASPLGRTRETMEIVRQEMALPVDDYRIDKQLLEISFGDWEGYTLEEIARKSKKLVQDRITRKWDFIAPGGENYDMLCKRLEPWLSAVATDTVAVCHGGIIRALLVMLGAMTTDGAAAFVVPQDQIYVWHGKQGEWI